MQSFCNGIGFRRNKKKRSAYYKNLRKEQRKRRKQRNREDEMKRQQQARKTRFEELVKKIREKGREEHEPESRYLNLMDQGILVIDKTEQCPANRPKSAERRPKEIDGNSLVKLGKTIGSGTYGSCQLASYRGMTVVTKEYKSFRSGLADTQRQRKAPLHEANILSSLGDHPNFPLLLGVQVKKLPFGLVTQFHGDKNGSLTLWRAAPKLELSNEKCVNVTKMIGNAIQFIHSQKVTHNDLRPNNIALEKRDGVFHPIVIDFGKSLKVEVASASLRRCISKENQRNHLKTYPYGAPELVNGGLPSFSSDTYSFAKIFDCLREEKSNLQLNSA